MVNLCKRSVMDGIVYKSRKDNFLVYSLIVWGVLEFLYHFVQFEGGGIGPFVVAIKGRELLEVFIVLLLSLSLLGGKTRSKLKTDKNVAIILAFFLFIYWILCFFTANILGIIDLLCQILIVILFVLLRDDIKFRVFDGFIRILAFLLFLSIIEYLIYQVTGFRIVVFGNLLRVGDKLFDQTLFNFMPQYRSYSFIGLPEIFRFQSLSEEPGSVGTTCALLLFATGGSKQYRFQHVVFWIAGILSLSLAFYAMAFAYLLFSTTKLKHIIPLLLLCVFFVYIYYSFQDVFDSFLLKRLQSDDIDNRTSEELSQAIARSWRDGSLWLGHKLDSNLLEGGSGIKLILYNVGIIGVLSIVLGYTKAYLIKMKSLKVSHWSCIAFLIVFWISYYQRAYLLMFQFVLPFFTMPVFLSYVESINKSSLTFNKQF